MVATDWLTQLLCQNTGKHEMVATDWLAELLSVRIQENMKWLLQTDLLSCSVSEYRKTWNCCYRLTHWAAQCQSTGKHEIVATVWPAELLSATGKREMVVPVWAAELISARGKHEMVATVIPLPSTAWKILLLKLIMILSQNRDPVHWHYVHRLVLCRQQKTVTYRSLLPPVLSYCCCYLCCCCYWCWKLKMLKLKAVHNYISNFGSSRILGSVLNTVSHPVLSDRYFCRGSKSYQFSL